MPSNEVVKMLKGELLTKQDVVINLIVDMADKIPLQITKKLAYKK